MGSDSAFGEAFYPQTGTGRVTYRKPVDTEQLRRLLKTIPIMPHYANIIFWAENLAPPAESSRLGYLRACEALQVLPYSSLLFESLQSDIHQAKMKITSTTSFIPRDLDSEESEIVKRIYLKGGRPQEVALSTHNSTHASSQIASILDARYAPQSAILAFNREGTTRVSYNREAQDNSARLVLDQAVDLETGAMLHQWLKRAKEL